MSGEWVREDRRGASQRKGRGSPDQGRDETRAFLVERTVCGGSGAILKGHKGPWNGIEIGGNL